MAYTVKKLAKASGVSIRTLHFYDEIGLLAPAYVGDNGYRYYQEDQLLMLQQILFFRELGFELKEIQKILSQKDFDKVQALQSHKEALLAKQKRVNELVLTIDKTIEQLNGERKMNAQELYRGFSPEKQAAYEEYLVNHLGDKAKKHIAESKANIAKMTKGQHDKTFDEWHAICEDLRQAMDKNESVHSNSVQAIIQRHYQFIKKFWVPDHDAYIGLGLGYTAFEWKQAFEKYDSQHPKLACYMTDAMKIFADRKLKHQ